MLLFYNNQTYKFKLLHVLEFNSTRKRMSVILKNDSTNEILLLCKGADSVIEERIHSDNDSKAKKCVWENLERYAIVGLRTLLLAERIIPNDEYNAWNEKYLKACTALQNREE